MEKYTSIETGKLHPLLTERLKGRSVDKVTMANCDEGFVIHFTDGTKLEAGWSGCEGVAALNGEKVNVSGL